MAGSGKTLTALGQLLEGPQATASSTRPASSAALLPATDDPARDLEIFEKLMAMDDESVRRSLEAPAEAQGDSRHADPSPALPTTSPSSRRASCQTPRLWTGRSRNTPTVKVAWRADSRELERAASGGADAAQGAYRERVDQPQRPEEVMDTVHDHIWDARQRPPRHQAPIRFPELVEQLGIMRFGHRPRVADTFCGSGQIPFRGGPARVRRLRLRPQPGGVHAHLGRIQHCRAAPGEPRSWRRTSWNSCAAVQAEIDKLGVETDGKGWRAKVFLYCVESALPADWLDGARCCLPGVVSKKAIDVVAELGAGPVDGISDTTFKSAPGSARPKSKLRRRAPWAEEGQVRRSVLDTPAWMA